jgi:tRNA-splicing ligase RtcB
MRLTICEEPLVALDAKRPRLKQALRDETRFGMGAHFDRGHERRHDVMDDPAWREVQLLALHRDTAAAQLGSSGTGNHFVEFGELETAGIPELELPAGTYLALLSHSGSRGLGSKIAEHYTKVAMRRHPLPKPAQHLAWLGLDESDGQEYWRAMELAGRYAAANHELIHEHVLRAAGLRRLAQVENHHNFAWLEEHGGEQVVVHRKGATPAGVGVLGVIPGSMGDPGYVVRGKGHPASLASAAHGAGRRMSRSKAKASLTRQQQDDYLRARGIELLDAGLDEAPQAYKPIAEVMAAQDELIETLAEFRPKLVLMASGGRAED